MRYLFALLALVVAAAAHADVRARWFIFRSERLHEVMDGWMEANKISPATPPPWK